MAREVFYGEEKVGKSTRRSQTILIFSTLWLFLNSSDTNQPGLKLPMAELGYVRPRVGNAKIEMKGKVS